MPFGIFHTVRLSQTCCGYILKTITDLNIQLQGYLDHIEENAVHKNHNTPPTHFRVIDLTIAITQRLLEI